MEFTYIRETDSFGTEFATVDITKDGETVAHFLTIPAEDGMTEDYVKSHLEELSAKFKPMPIVSTDERIDDLEKTIGLLADAIIHPVTGTVSAWAALVHAGLASLSDVPSTLRDAVVKIIESIWKR